MDSLRRAKTSLLSTGGRGRRAAPDDDAAAGAGDAAAALDALDLVDAGAPAHRARPPKPRPTLLGLGLPWTGPATPPPDEALAGSARKVTAARAASSREVLARVLAMRRGTDVVGAALREYVPYAAACAAIADGLRARNKVLPRDPFRWEGVLGGRGAGIAAGVDGGFAVELAFVLFTDALLKVHVVLAPEGRTALDGADPTALMAAGRELQAAAGVFRYIADEAVPRALAALSTPPPPELDAHVNAALAALCLAVAQCLVVRNAELSSYPPSTLVKLSLGAHALCTRAAEAADACAPLLSPLVAATGRDLAAFMQGWSQRLLAVNAHEEGRLGEKTGRVRAALRCMSELAASGGAVGALAADRSAQYAETMREYEEDVRREIVRELPEDELGMSRMETKVIVQEVKYSLPVAEVVKKKPKA